MRSSRRCRKGFVTGLALAAALTSAACSGGKRPGSSPYSTNPRDITGSVPWSTAGVAPDGVSITVHHVATCTGNARLDIKETAHSVVIRVLTVEPAEPHGCLGIALGYPATSVGRLRAPLDGRIIRHGKVTGEV